MLHSVLCRVTLKKKTKKYLGGTSPGLQNRICLIYKPGKYECESYVKILNLEDMCSVYWMICQQEMLILVCCMSVVKHIILLNAFKAYYRPCFLLEKQAHVAKLCKHLLLGACLGGGGGGCLLICPCHYFMVFYHLKLNNRIYR